MYRLAFLVAALGGAVSACAPVDRRLVRPNDNRTPAGHARGGVRTVRLDIVRAEWRPEADSGPGIRVEAFAEEGRAPQIPAPLLRAPAGDTIALTVRNTLDSAVMLYGLATRPAKPDSIIVRAGDSVRVRFAVGAAGTYLYAAEVAGRRLDREEKETMAGALVVDPAGAVPDDRVFVINIWGFQADSQTYRNALTINGKAFPFSERVGATVGDTVRWRVINASQRQHPMHLHGFYFRVGSLGDGWSDSAMARGLEPQVVTQTMPPYSTMSLAWTPDRPGNWLFHCHLGFHVVPLAARFTPAEPGDSLRAHESLSHDAARHMAGLALGITVRALPGTADAAPPPGAPALRLFVDEGVRRHRAPRAMGFVLQQGDREPARDSVGVTGSLLILERGRGADIVVINRLEDPTGVHWHGIELLSWSDGVPGWSGTAPNVAPAILPGDSFLAHLRLPRAGTFMYHTHLDDLVQLTSGLYGPLVVTEPGHPFDPATDHVLLASWDGLQDPPHLLINGDSTRSAPLVLARGVAQRFRLINIGVAKSVRFALQRGSRAQAWRWIAKDGADLPAARSSDMEWGQVNVGETADFRWTPPAAGEWRLVAGLPGAPPCWTQRVVVR